MTVQGDSLLASNSPMWPWLVTMLTHWAGSVGTLPVRGGLTGLTALSGDAGYWQLAPTLADAWNGGSGATGPVSGADGLVLAGELLGVDDAVSLLWSFFEVTTAITTAATTATAAMTPPAITRMRRRLACLARRSSCRSSLRLAVARRCSLVGTAAIFPCRPVGPAVAFRRR